jgi:hypothetical protein
MTAQEYKAPESVNRLQMSALAVGVIALIVGCFLGLRNQDNFFRAYLMSYMLILGLALGSLGLVMLQHLTGGQWGIIIRRPLESATRTLPLLAILFLPIFLFGMEHLYGAWLHPDEPLSKMQVSWLTQSGYRIRAVIYFAVWLVLMGLFNYWSRQQDIHREDRALRRRLKMVAALGIDDLRFLVRRRAIDLLAGADDRRGGAARAHRAACGNFAKTPSARPGRPALRFRYAVGVFFLFAASDYLVGKSAGRDHLLPLAPLRQLGRCGHRRFDLSLFRAVLFVAVERLEAQRAAAPESGPVDDYHAPGGPLLADAAGVLPQRAATPVGFCTAGSLAGNLGSVFCVEFEARTAFAAGRSETCRGHFKS